MCLPYLKNKKDTLNWVPLGQVDCYLLVIVVFIVVIVIIIRNADSFFKLLSPRNMAAIASALCSIRGVDIPTSTCAVAIRMLVRIRSAHIVLLSQHKRMIAYSYTVSKAFGV